MEDISKVLNRANMALSELMNSGKIQDMRRNKGANSYSEIVSDSFNLICELMAAGHTLTGIFRCLQDKDIFNESADCASFFRAVKREQRRRNRKYVADRQKETSASPVKSQKVIAAYGSETAAPVSIPDGIEYERDGKKYVRWQNKVLEVPEGFRFLRGKICPEVDDKRLDNKDERQFNFEDYPKHIQDAINESSRNGTVLEDAERNRKLIDEWKSGIR